MQSSLPTHRDLRAETAALRRAEESRGDDMNGGRSETGIRRFWLPIAVKLFCDTLLLRVKAPCWLVPVDSGAAPCPLHRAGSGEAPRRLVHDSRSYAFA